MPRRLVPAATGTDHCPARRYGGRDPQLELPDSALSTVADGLLALASLADLDRR